MVKVGDMVFFVSQNQVRVGKVLSMVDKSDARIIDFASLRVKKRNIWEMMNLKRANELKERYFDNYGK